MKKFNLTTKVLSALMAAAMTFTMPSNVFAANELEVTKAASTTIQAGTYVLMNIPYADFYKADVNNDVEVDAFTSATKSKTMTSSLAGGSYHVNSDGTDITGITFPVKVMEDVDASELKQVLDTDTFDLTVSGRGGVTTTTYTGSETLFYNPSYAYYVLSDTPSYYKELTVVDGKLTFGKVVGEVTKVDGAGATLSTDTTYGDYQLNITGFTNVEANVDQVYGVIVSTEEGNDYGMRHLENIWRVTSLAWCTGFTSDVHGCPTSSAHYEAMMGQSINKITYFTSKGIFEIDVDPIYVPVTIEGSVSVEDSAVSGGQANVTLSELPTDFDPVYQVSGLDNVAVSDGVLSFDSSADAGNYTLKVTDNSGKYVGFSDSFNLYVDEMPAKYDKETTSLVVNDGSDEDDFSDYISSITSVSVNETSYSATGRNAVKLFDEEGKLDTENTAFAEGNSFEIVVKATGYKDLTFYYGVDLSELKSEIATTEDLNEADYTAESWAALQTALANSNAALESHETQEAVDAAAAELKSAIDGLALSNNNNNNNNDNNDNNNNDNNNNTVDNTNNNTNVSEENNETENTAATTTTETTSGASVSSSSVKTGDASHVWSMVVVAVISMGAALFTAKKRKSVQ